MFYSVNTNLPSLWEGFESLSDFTRQTDTLEIKNLDDHSAIEVDMPGLKKEEIKITHTNGKLLVEGKNATRTVKRTYTVKEGFFDVENLEAKLDLGVLTIKIPRKAELKPRQFLIN